MRHPNARRSAASQQSLDRPGADAGIFRDRGGFALIGVNDNGMVSGKEGSVGGGAMSDVLADAFRHNAWAMKALIAACERLSVEELSRPGAGFGSILATLNHLVLSDAGYVASLGGGRASWATAGETHASVVIVQALHHVTAHGEQVRAGLKVLGFEPPDVQPWALADATGRSRWLRPEG